MRRWEDGPLLRHGVGDELGEAQLGVGALGLIIGPGCVEADDSDIPQSDDGEADDEHRAERAGENPSHYWTVLRNASGVSRFGLFDAHRTRRPSTASREEGLRPSYRRRPRSHAG